MKAKLMTVVLGILFSSALVTSCKKDAQEQNDEELITTMKLTFVPVSGGTTVTYQFKDVDGPGGAAATQNEIVLAPSKFYNVTVQLLNESVTPAEDITLEVAKEADAHRFYYEPAAGSNITVSNLNNDANSVPLGITSNWATGAAATGKVKVTLRHYPNTPPSKAVGDLVNSSKSGTDIEVEFATKIQ